jgi:tetratricopeptide (TPR) repeat protein
LENSLNQAIAAHKAGNLQLAEKSYNRILSAEPDNTDALNAMGILHLQRGNPRAALECFDRAARLAPDIAKVHTNIGNAQLALENSAAAISAFERAVSLAPNDADFRANVAAARLRAGDAAGAEKDLRKALDLDGDNYSAGQNLGALLSKQNRLGEALPYLERAVRHPDCRTETKLNLASTYEKLNRLADAERTLDGLMEKVHPAAVIQRARLLRRRDRPAEALTMLQESDDGADLDALGEEVAGDWCHETALCADLLGKSDLAYENVLAAKARWRLASGSKGGEGFLEKVRVLRQAAGAGNGREVDVPVVEHRPAQVFFVGFPRSGTTLLEVILDAHPDIVATAETDILASVLDRGDQPDSAAAQSRYMEAFVRLYGAIDPAATIVDKHPLNLIHCRSMDELFPHARLLVALRDPRDVVLSCLMQRFRRNTAMRNFDTLDSTVALYEAVMGLWLDARSSLRLPWHEYRYEDLIADRDATLAGILKFIGVEWHADMDAYRDLAAAREITTPSHNGVLEPIYDRAVGRWRAYENHLAPALDRLAPFVAAFGYDS